MVQQLMKQSEEKKKQDIREAEMIADHEIHRPPIVKNMKEDLRNIN